MVLKFISLSGFLEGVGGFLGFLVGVLFIYVLMTLVAKLFNTNIVSRSGEPIANAGTFDGIVELSKNGAKKSLDRIKNENRNIWSKLNAKSADKIEKITLLAKLKSDGVINEEEFQALKKEIL